MRPFLGLLILAAYSVLVFDACAQENNQVFGAAIFALCLPAPLFALLLGRLFQKCLPRHPTAILGLLFALYTIVSAGLTKGLESMSLVLPAIVAGWFLYAAYVVLRYFIVGAQVLSHRWDKRMQIGPYQADWRGKIPPANKK